LYEPYEIDISEKILKEILKRIDGRICLLGGWATYQIVSEKKESAEIANNDFLSLRLGR